VRTILGTPLWQRNPVSDEIVFLGEAPAPLKLRARSGVAGVQGPPRPATLERPRSA